MPKTEQVNWQPISQMPLIASMIDTSLSDTREHLGTLSKAKDRPHVLDDATIDRVEQVHTEQMDYVEKYFLPYKNVLQTIEDVYMAILWPAAIGKTNSWVLFSKPSAQYDRNSGLDADKDGHVTKAEAAAMVKGKLIKGRGNGYFG